jgi:hypothetical protein
MAESTDLDSVLPLCGFQMSQFSLTVFKNRIKIANDSQTAHSHQRANVARRESKQSRKCTREGSRQVTCFDPLFVTGLTQPQTHHLCSCKHAIRGLLIYCKYAQAFEAKKIVYTHSKRPAAASPKRSIVCGPLQGPWRPLANPRNDLAHPPCSIIAHSGCARTSRSPRRALAMAATIGSIVMGPNILYFFDLIFVTRHARATVRTGKKRS